MTPNVCTDCTRVGCPVAGEISAYAKSCAHKPKEPRVCVREEYAEAAGTYIGEKELYDYVLKEWEFLYSDGTTETVTSRERVE